MTRSSLPLVELFSKPDCHLCEDAKTLLRKVQSAHPFTLHEIDITNQEALMAQYGEEIPVVFVNGRKAFKYRVDPQQFMRRLQRAQGHDAHKLWQRLWQR